MHTKKCSTLTLRFFARFLTLASVTGSAVFCLEPVAWSQGCINSPNNPNCSIGGDHTEGMSQAGRFSVGINYRYFESFRHYRGDEEQTQREEIGNNVINTVHGIDLTAAYGLTAQWSVSLDLPFSVNDRSSWYEHTGTNRHTMSSAGLGDLRLETRYWLLDPVKHMDGNISLGLGLKLPTGDDSVKDTAYRQTGPVERPVDPSIQLGDGGWGVILELEGYQKILPHLFGYVQGSYMLTPQEHNDTQFTIADRANWPAELKYNSIPDQYFGRGGFTYVFWPEKGLALSFGARIEGVPAWDAIGDSMGFRRPGYTISVEPGLSWNWRNNSLSVYSPVAVYRNRVRSAPEEVLGRPGGDAAFADYSILASFLHVF